MMEDVIYGVILSAKIDIFSKEPPVNAEKKLNASFELLSKPLREVISVYSRYRKLTTHTNHNHHAECEE